MDISIKLVYDFPYSTGMHRFPVEIEISTDSPIEIHSRVDVVAAIITRLDEPDTVFGYRKSITPAKRETIVLLPKCPLRMQIDVFEHDDDFVSYGSGGYRCDVKVLVAAKVGERFRYVELQESLEVMVA